MFDMTQCKVGDELVIKSGDIVKVDAIYPKHCDERYGYILDYDGHEYTVSPLGEYCIGDVNEWDVVCFAKIIKAKEPTQDIHQLTLDLSREQLLSLRSQIDKLLDASSGE